MIVPLWPKVDRVIGGRSDPSNNYANDNVAPTKTEHLETWFFRVRTSLPPTASSSVVPLARQGLLSDYDIIIDEVPEVVRSVSSKSKVSIEEFYLNTGYMTVDTKTGQVRPTGKWWSMRDDVDDTLSTTILNYANTGCLYLLRTISSSGPCPREPDRWKDNYDPDLQV